MDDNDEIDFEADIGALGLTLDTNVARDRIFNYRLELLVEFVDATIDYDEAAIAGFAAFNPNNFPSLDQDVDGVGFGISQTFGFGIVRTRAVRLYLGPKIRVGVWTGESDDNVGAFDDVRYVGVDAGIGAELGMNIHLGDHVSISPTVSYIAGAGYIATDDDRRPFNGGSNSNYGYVGFNNRVSVGVSVLFRSAGDVF